MAKKRLKKSVKNKIACFFALLVETVILIVIALYFTMFVLAKGPSPTARNLFVMSVRETSALKFLANLYCSEEEIAEIENSTELVYEGTDTSLINIQDNEDNDSGNSKGGVDEWGLVDDDNDGLILEEIVGDGYRGYMLVVLDPSRVIVGSRPDMYEQRGFTVDQYAEYYGAVAAINAGGFYDPNGMGDGSIPDSLIVYDGKYYYTELGTRDGFVGLDDKNIMYVGRMTLEDIQNANIQYGVCFGPALVVNGEMVDPNSLPSGVNPRTAIGQRSDGAILMLVIDGRQATSLGAKYQDLAEIMYSYGAVNANNLDGGSSSLMWVNGEYVNNSASVIGIRDMPSSFVVLP